MAESRPSYCYIQVQCRYYNYALDIRQAVITSSLLHASRHPSPPKFHLRRHQHPWRTLDLGDLALHPLSLFVLRNRHDEDGQVYDHQDEAKDNNSYQVREQRHAPAHEYVRIRVRASRFPDTKVVAFHVVQLIREERTHTASKQPSDEVEADMHCRDPSSVTGPEKAGDQLRAADNNQ